MDFPQINGQFYSWAELTPSIEIYDGESIQTKDFSAIDYEHALEGAEVPGVGSMSLGRTTGVYTSSGSISMYLAAQERFTDALAKLSPKGNTYGTVKFDLVVSWAGEDGRVYTHKLVGCRIQSEGHTHAPGADATVVTMPLSVTKVMKKAADGTWKSLV